MCGYGAGVERIKRWVSQLFNRLQNFTGSAKLHLFLPIFVNSSVTDSSVNEPAKISGLKLPSRALLFLFRRAFFNNPTRLGYCRIPSHSGNQEKHLPFHMGRYVSPALFVALYSLVGYPQQLGYLALCFIYSFAEAFKLFTIHGNL